MSSKRWIAAFLATVLLIAAGVAGFNFLADPYGVFPGSLWEWPGYEMTKNPRTAKLTYLEKNHDKYDSYIVGCSSTSSYPTQQINEYFDASFYNMIMYGADMLDVEQMATYLVEHYTVKNLVVNVYISNAETYNVESDPISYTMPAKATGENPIAFYSKYLFLDPRIGAQKLSDLKQDTWQIQDFDVFDAETGAYDKKERDIEPIGSMEEYLQAYPVFADYPKSKEATSEAAIAGTMKSLAAIRDLCREHGINMVVITAPLYWGCLNRYDWNTVVDFYTRLAEVTPYWDFSISSVSFEPRYFYDATHFRNCVGKMALARIFNDDSVYIPEDFGTYVTAQTVSEHLQQAHQAVALPETEYTADVPVLMYHHIATDSDSANIISPDLFEQQIAALAEAGYQAVTPDQLSAYVNQGAALPEKPVVITFDDGYLSNYEYAYPILQKYGMCATIFVVGATVGNQEHYKDTEYPITPHFTYAQAKEMVDSGVISIQSHTYDMHQWAAYEDGRARENILRWADEPEDTYHAALTADCQRIREEIMAGTGETSVHVMAYPTGKSDDLSRMILAENGFDITFSTQSGSNTLIKGQPQSLLCMSRFTMNDGVSVEQLLQWVSTARG